VRRGGRTVAILGPEQVVLRSRCTIGPAASSSVCTSENGGCRLSFHPGLNRLPRPSRVWPPKIHSSETPCIVQWARMTAMGKVVFPGPGEGPEFRFALDRFLVKGGHSQASGLFAVMEYAGAAGQVEPAPHLHRTFEETWFILEGEMRLIDGNQIIAATRRVYLLVPRNVSATFQVMGTFPYVGWESSPPGCTLD